MPVAQLERRMTTTELQEWVLFEREFGPLTVHERIDAAAELVGYVTHASHGGTGKLADFLPQWRPVAQVDIVDYFRAIATRAG